MKKLKSLALGFAFLLAIQLLSNCIINILHIPFPSPLFGMVVFALLLYFKVISHSLVKDICDLLLSNMALFFIPLLVGIISYSALIKSNLVPIVVTIILTTFITMLLSAFVVELIIKLTAKGVRND